MRNALGKGLSALIPEQEQQAQPQAGITEASSHLIVAIEKIRANRFQPRKNFDDARLAELAESIKEHGLAQPIIVSQNDHDSGFELIAGERRLRACELAGLKEVEVIVRKANSDKQRLAISLVENLQREDLNAVEEALGYLRLMKEFNINQTELTKVVGKSKSAISNTLRLLELPDNIQNAINDGSITEGHARALLMTGSDDRRQLLLKNIIEQKLSVRDAEDMARGLSAGDSDSTIRKRHKTAKSADVKNIETSLQHVLGTKVDIRTKKDLNKGSITIHFYSIDDFDKIVNILKK